MKNFSVKTKENSYRNSSSGGQGKKYLVWVITALIVLIFAKDVVQGMTSLVTTTLYTIRHYVATSGATIPVFIRSRIELQDRIQELEQKIASQNGMDATLNYISLENEELRGLLGGTSVSRIVAGVIARPPLTPYDTVVLDRGSEDGIVLHAPVFHDGGTAIGYVKSVSGHTSFVTLFSSPGVKTTVYVFGSQIFTTAYGEGGGVVRLSVPQGIVLEEGSPVILPTLDSGVLGTISEIQSISTEPEQHAYVTLGAPLQSMRLVAVGTRAVEQVSYDEAIANIETAEEELFHIEVGEELREYSTLGVLPDSLGSTTASTSPSNTTP